MIGKKTRPFDTSRSQLTKTKNQFDRRTHYVPINQYRVNHSPTYTLSTCCSSTKNTSSSASGCSSCQCSSSKSSSIESR